MATKNAKLDAFKKALDIINSDKSKILASDNGNLIQTLSERPMNVETISTGSLVLDSISGGGFPKGRVIEIYGAESSGKCLTPDTMIVTERGLMTLGEMFEFLGEEITDPEDDTMEVIDVSEKNFRVVNENNNLEQVLALTKNGSKETRTITLHDGRQLTATLNHPVRVLDDNGDIVWRNVADLEVDDVVVSMFHKNDKVGSDTMSADAATLLGYLIAGAHIDSEDALHIPYLGDDYLMLECEKLVRGLAEEHNIDDVVFDRKSETSDLYIRSENFRNLLRDRYGLTLVANNEKIVPKPVLQGNRDVQIGFLTGLMNAAGVVEAPGYVEYLASSRVFLEQTQLMLLGFGIASEILDDDFFWALHISPYYAEIFMNNMPESFDGKIDRNTVSSNPFSAKEYYRYVSIVNIVENEPQPTFDITLTDTHSFIGNGIINHNTSIALTAAANVQKEGGTVAFIDLENALDPRYAKRLGVNVEDMAVAQPDHAEQALELVQRLTETGVVDLIVVDSVAALVPQAELEGDMGDQTMAVVARLMSRALKKLVSAANRKGTTIIFINQMREKVGFVLGDPTITPGGKALKFFASQRIKVNKTGKVSEGGKEIGTSVKFTVIKNKIAPPFGTGSSILTFNKGINRAAELVEVGPEYGVIVKKNARTYIDAETGEVIGTSKAQAIETLENNPELFESISENMSKVISENIYGQESDALKEGEAVEEETE